MGILGARDTNFTNFTNLKPRGIQPRESAKSAAPLPPQPNRYNVKWVKSVEWKKLARAAETFVDSTTRLSRRPWCEKVASQPLQKRTKKASCC